MAIVFHCKCGHLLRAQPESAGKRTKCPSCTQVLTIPAPAAAAKPAMAGQAASTATGPPVAQEDDPFAMELDWSVLKAAPHIDVPPTPTISSAAIRIDSGPSDSAHEEPPAAEDGSRQYRVLTQKDQGFTGKFNSTKLEEVLNDHARRGWLLKAAVVMNMPGHAGHHDELVVILER